MARSNTTLEYKGLTHAVAELLWIQLLQELGLFLFAPPILWYDNFYAIHLTINPVFHAHTKHIVIDFHFVQEQLA